MSLPFGIAAALLVASAAAAAQDGDPDLPERSSSLVVYGDDPCPKAQDDEEIVVCARRPETERYRIPKEFRKNKDERGSVAWGARFDQLEEATRYTRPNSCSVVGTWGQTGCWNMNIGRWAAERRAMQAEANAIP
ncbi:hypothetical protein [Sphingosinicella sp. BN140058]|uniref:hypothetical protein n=1 Tax=Sphingosinicella sp. BN140058 TaxID=1892855 RepID=UPI001FB148B3|nr:hypothetical protein [Sphingosinicella sp. BN140058]